MTFPRAAFPVDFQGLWYYNEDRIYKVVDFMRSGQSAPWRVIYIARGEKQAEQIEALLSSAGFLCDWKRPQDSSKPCDGSKPHDGARAEDIEIKALEAEAEEARLYLMEQGL